MKSKSDVDLMHLVEQKHRSAFDELYERYIKLIYSYAMKATGGNSDDTKEIVQQVFLRIWTTNSPFDPSKGQLVNWIITITRNISIDFIRKEKRIEEKKQSIMEQQSTMQGEGSLQQLVGPTNMEINEAKSYLTEEQRRLIELLYWQGYSLKEIAAKEKQPIGTIKSRLHQSLKRLRYYLGS